MARFLAGLSLALTALVLAAALFAAPTTAAAQSSFGIPPFSSVGGGPDAINLSNLGIVYTIPVFSRAGRGSPFSIVQSPDSKHARTRTMGSDAKPPKQIPRTAHPTTPTIPTAHVEPQTAISSRKWMLMGTRAVIATMRFIESPTFSLAKAAVAHPLSSVFDTTARRMAFCLFRAAIRPPTPAGV